jgi:hypothetical protein
VSVEEQGYAAHSQNADRDSNPFTRLAQEWDDGWAKREREKRKHQLDDEPVVSFVEHLLGSA